MTTSKHLHRRVLTILLALYGAVGLWYVLQIPPGEGMDEALHFDYADFIARERRLPVHGQVIMVHHPPLHYLLSAPLLLPFDTADRPAALQPNPHFVWDESGSHGWRVTLPPPEALSPSGTIAALYVLRVFGLALGAAALGFIYLSAKELLPDRPWAPLAVTAVVGLNPTFVSVASTYHHDVLVIAIFAAGLWWCLRYLTRPVTVRSLLVAGALVGAASLSKLSGISLAPTVVLLLLLRPAAERDWRTRLHHILVVGLVAGAVAGWWFARNWVLYGDPTGQWLFRENFPHMLRPTSMTWGIFRQEVIGQLEKTFWGTFGFGHILVPPTVRTVVWACAGAMLLGWVFWGWRWLRGARPTRTAVLAWAVMACALVLLGLFLVRFSFFALAAGQGRYLLPASVAIGALLVVGLNGYTNWRFQAITSVGLSVVMLLYAIVTPAAYVWPRYRIPDTVPESELARAVRLDVTLDGGIELAAVRTSDAIVIPGQGLDVTTYWAAVPGVARYADARVRLSLVSAQGQVIGSADFWPEMDTVPAVWGDRIVANTQSFYIPRDQAASTVRVEVEVRDGQNGPSLAVQDVASPTSQVTIAELLALGSVVRVAEPDLPVDRRQEVFAEALHLVSVGLPEGTMPGDVLPVAFYWQVLEGVSRDYTVFVHVINQADEIVAQLDRPPGGGTSPTSTWQAGETLMDTYPVPLPEDLPSGEYRVRVGLYTWPDLVRAPITVDGAGIGDSLIVGAFSVTH